MKFWLSLDTHLFINNTTGCTSIGRRFDLGSNSWWFESTHLDMICEECKKEFEGNTRFCSKSCRCKHNGRMCNKNGKLNGHKQFNTGRTCWKAKPEGWTCCWCACHFRTRRLLQKHKQDEHVDIKSSGHAWNKGLTKETSEKVRQSAETLSNRIQTGEIVQKHHIWTDEERRLQSERKKKLYAEHPEKHPNVKLAGNRGKMTYPEQLTFDWLNEHSIQNEHNYHFVTDKFNRYVDFYLPTLNVFIEVDGEHWHKDTQKDVDKDNDALSCGIKTIRIKPKLNVIKQLEDALL